MISEWNFKNQNSSYRGKFQGNFDERKGNLVRVIRVNRVKSGVKSMGKGLNSSFSGEFELKTCQIPVYRSDFLVRLMSMPRVSVFCFNSVMLVGPCVTGYMSLSLPVVIQPLSRASNG